MVAVVSEGVTDDRRKAIAVTVEAIRSMLRVLPSDEDRALVLHELTAVTPPGGDTKQRIEEALRAAGTVVGAARILGVSKRTLQDRMREHGFPIRPAGRRRKL